MTNSDLERAAAFLLRYARAIEAKLYMGMKLEEAHASIEEAERLAQVLRAAAQESSQNNQNK